MIQARSAAHQNNKCRHRHLRLKIDEKIENNCQTTEHMHSLQERAMPRLLLAGGAEADSCRKYPNDVQPLRSGSPDDGQPPTGFYNIKATGPRPVIYGYGIVNRWPPSPTDDPAAPTAPSSAAGYRRAPHRNADSRPRSKARYRRPQPPPAALRSRPRRFCDYSPFRQVGLSIAVTRRSEEVSLRVGSGSVGG